MTGQSHRDIKTWIKPPIVSFFSKPLIWEGSGLSYCPLPFFSPKNKDNLGEKKRERIVFAGLFLLLDTKNPFV
jgi:hypothetical protein